MYVTVPDPFPGRCVNHRFCTSTMQMVRCLDYEDELHVCSFPEPPPQVYTTGTWVTRNNQGQWEPKPWVKPGDRT